MSLLAMHARPVGRTCVSVQAQRARSGGAPGTRNAAHPCRTWTASLVSASRGHRPGPHLAGLALQAHELRRQLQLRPAPRAGNPCSCATAQKAASTAAVATLTVGTQQTSKKKPRTNLAHKFAVLFTWSAMSLRTSCKTMFDICKIVAHTPYNNV